jgi:hypothetical protein
MIAKSSSVRRAFVMSSALATMIGMGHAVSASTVTAGACAAPQTWTFSPPLTAQVQAGTITFSQKVVCVVATASTDPVSETVSAPVFDNVGSLGYFGDCSVAVVTSGDLSFLLLNGSVVAGADPEFIFGQAAVLVPDQICNEVTATGPAVAVAAIGP